MIMKKEIIVSNINLYTLLIFPAFDDSEIDRYGTIKKVF